MLVVVSATAGVLVAGVLIPFVGSAGIAAKSASETFESLPTALTMPELAQRTQIFAADGSVIANFYYQNREVVPLRDVPVISRNALIAIEDSRFYSDEGIDLKGVLRAAVTNAGSGSIQQGGSTLTQQLVKNILVQTATTAQGQQAATADTLSRKIREARYAIALAHKLTKDQILQRYLNIVYFGDGAYGIAAAAKHYFGIPVQHLNLPQSALLAGLVRSPSAYDPRLHPDAATQRRNTVLARMQQLGYISAAQAKQAEQSPLGLKITEVGSGCESSWAPFFCDYVVNEILSDPSLGKTRDDRVKLLLEGGLKVYTTLNPKTQRDAQHAVDTTIPPNNTANHGHGIATAAVTVQPGTGRVVAMAVDRHFGHLNKPGYTEVNYATGGSTGFQAGSTFKAFVLAVAIRDGIPLNTTLNCPHDYLSKAFPNDRPYPYPVHNAGDSEAGTFDIVQATWRSVNTCYAQIEAMTGATAPAKLAEQMGVHLFPDKPLQPVASFFLGVNAVSPLDMAGAYATFAAQGEYCAKHGVDRIVDGSGKVLENAKPQCSQVMPKKVAEKVTSVLQGVVNGPDPYRTGAGADFGRPAAGKTGTTDNEQMAWFVGYTPGLATAVWVGDPRGPAYPLHNIKVDGKYYPVVYGGDLPATIWKSTMSAALQGKPVQNFALPMAKSHPSACKITSVGGQLQASVHNRCPAPAPSPSATPSPTATPSPAASPSPSPSPSPHHSSGHPSPAPSPSKTSTKPPGHHKHSPSPKP